MTHIPIAFPSRAAAAVAAVAVLTLAAGCATLNAVDSDVSSYGDWPAGKAPGTYAFDRLPSQSAHPERQAQLEQAAGDALAQAGFRPAADPAQADVVVQIGARIEVTEITPWADPLWYHGPWGPWGPYAPAYVAGPYPPHYGLRPYGWWGAGPWGGPLAYDTRYTRQVALLLRDRASGKPLYEAHAESSGATTGGDRVVAAMFAATLAEFPRTEAKPHTVRTVPMAEAPAAAPVPASAPAS